MHLNGCEEGVIDIEQLVVGLHHQDPIAKADKEAVHDAFDEVDLPPRKQELLAQPQNVAEKPRYRGFEHAHAGRLVFLEIPQQFFLARQFDDQVQVPDAVEVLVIGRGADLLFPREPNADGIGVGVRDGDDFGAKLGKSPGIEHLQESLAALAPADDRDLHGFRHAALHSGKPVPAIGIPAAKQSSDKHGARIVGDHGRIVSGSECKNFIHRFLDEGNPIVGIEKGNAGGGIRKPWNTKGEKQERGAVPPSREKARRTFCIIFYHPISFLYKTRGRRRGKWTTAAAWNKAGKGMAHLLPL